MRIALENTSHSQTYGDMVIKDSHLPITTMIVNVSSGCLSAVREEL